MRMPEAIKEADEVDEFDNNRLKVTGVYYLGPDKSKKNEILQEEHEDLVSEDDMEIGETLKDLVKFKIKKKMNER